MSAWGVASIVELIVKAVAAMGVGAASLIAGTHYAVRRGYLQPFSPWAKAIRRLSDPALKPMESRLVRSGRNPQDATLWLLGGSLLVGVLLISGTQWLVGTIAWSASMAASGPRAIAFLLISGATNLLILALAIRVFGSWFGVGRYSRVGRIVYPMTDWFLEPIRRRLPTFGPFDLSPLVGYFGLIVIRALLLGLL